MDRTNRECGSCTACCSYFPIKELNKPQLEPCRLLAAPGEDGLTGLPAGNCTVYGDHPQVCRKYSCMWLAGHGEDEDRPDRCGVLVDSMTPVENVLRACPLRAGAQDTPEGVLAVERISRSADKPVMVCRFPEAKLLRVVGRGVA